MFWFTLVVGGIAAAREPDRDLTAAVIDGDRDRIRTLIAQGAPPWPTLDALRRQSTEVPERWWVDPLIEVEPLLAARLAEADRSAIDTLSWLDMLLISHVREPLLCAGVAVGDAWLVAEALRRGESPQAVCDGHGVTLTAVAHPEVLGLLLDGGASTDACSLSASVAADQVVSVRLLLAAGANPRFGCGVVPLFASRSEAMVRELLGTGGLDPFEPSLLIEEYMQQWRYISNALAVSTDHPARRDQLLAWAWTAGVARPPVFAPFLPGRWGQVPHRATPGLTPAAFERAWTTAGGAAELLAARREGRIGEPLATLPCDPIETLTAARSRIGSLSRTAGGDHHRWYDGKGGHYHQREVDGRWETASWSMDLQQCPALAEIEPLLPALLGVQPWVTADGVVFGVVPDPQLPSGIRMSVGIPRGITPGG